MSRLHTFGMFAAVFVAGVVAAIGLVSVGCLGANAPFVGSCGHYPVVAVIILAIAAWFILGTLVVGIRAFRNNE